MIPYRLSAFITLPGICISFSNPKAVAGSGMKAAETAETREGKIEAYERVVR